MVQRELADSEPEVLGRRPVGKDGLCDSMLETAQPDWVVHKRGKRPLLPCPVFLSISPHLTLSLCLCVFVSLCVCVGVCSHPGPWLREASWCDPEPDSERTTSEPLFVRKGV